MTVLFSDEGGRSRRFCLERNHDSQQSQSYRNMPPNAGIEIDVGAALRSRERDSDHWIIGVRITITNVGNSPALHVRTWQELTIRNSPPALRADPNLIGSASHGTLQAHEILHIDTTIEPLTTEYGDVLMGRKILYLSGVFQCSTEAPSQPVCLTWCLQYVPDTKEFLPFGYLENLADSMRRFNLRNFGRE